MSTIRLEYFKAHCRADDLTEDDAYLQQTLDEAEAWVVRATHRSLDELCGGRGQLPGPLRRAVLMLGGHWYNMREAVSGGAQAEVPYGVSTLVKPYVKLRKE